MCFMMIMIIVIIIKWRKFITLPDNFIAIIIDIWCFEYEIRCDSSISSSSSSSFIIMILVQLVVIDSFLLKSSDLKEAEVDDDDDIDANDDAVSIDLLSQ